jgi:hypothetical protein
MQQWKSLAGMGLLVVLAVSGTGAVAVARSPAPDATAPIEFTAQYAWGPQVGFGTEAMVDGHWEVRGNVFAPSVVSVSDDRLGGSIRMTNDIDMYQIPGTDTTDAIWLRTWRIENDGGAWEGSALGVTFQDDSRTSYTMILRGEGGYAGLLAPVEVSHGPEVWNLHGFIVQADGPPGE